MPKKLSIGELSKQFPFRDIFWKTKEEYWKKLADYVYEMEDEEIVSLTQEYLDAGYDAFEAVNNGFVEGMNRAGDAFAEE